MGPFSERRSQYKAFTCVGLIELTMKEVISLTEQDLTVSCGGGQPYSLSLSLSQ